MSTALLTVLGVTDTPASAHNVLVSSTPEQGIILATAPGSIELVFDQDIATEYAKTALTIDQRKTVPVTPNINGRTVEINLPAMTAGQTANGSAAEWIIGYRVVSADGHPITGALSFTVGTGPAAHALAEQPTAQNSNTGAVVILGGATAIIAIGAAVHLTRRRTSRIDRLARQR